FRVYWSVCIRRPSQRQSTTPERQSGTRSPYGQTVPQRWWWWRPRQRNRGGGPGGIAARPPTAIRSAVRAEVEVVQRHRGAAGQPEPVVGLGVPGHRVHLGLRLLGRLDSDVAVPGDARTGRDELADDDVLLQADQRVAAGVDRRVREHPGRLLERGRR